MEKKMFCFQCQETVKNSGCTVNGMCGKRAEVANAMDELVQALKVLALTQKPSRELGRFVAESLFMTITNVNFDLARIAAQTARARTYSGSTAVTAPLGVLSAANEDVRSLRELLTYGLKGIAAYTEHALALGYEDDAIYAFFFKALAACTKDLPMPDLVDLVLECGNIAVKAMALLDKANHQTFGIPRATHVNTGVGKRPGILVSGHDLRDLLELLEQSKDAGIDVYTHGEMLPAHYYPGLKRYPHLFGNYGNAWYLQNREFVTFNGPILMTTNCIIPVLESYKDRIFTTGATGYPGVPHIADRVNNRPKDFSAIIKLAKNCPPPEPLEMGEIVGGYAHEQLLALEDTLIRAIANGAIRRLAVMGGCDGRHATRSYFHEVARKLPHDTVILTAGCAKYKYIKDNLGYIGNIPRVLDAGQCNDAYSIALFALKLKEKFRLQDVNDLPIAFDIAWYEQKAVAVLLALLALGFKKVRLGPTLPAFLSPRVTQVLVEKFGLQGITTPDEDVEAMLCDK